MCGRYSLTSPVESVVQLFDLDTRPNLPPRYNIAPTQEVAVVRTEGGARSLGLMRWGLVPAWAKDPAIGQRLINARGETAADKPSFRSAFKRRRCLIPADGFYEWQARGRGPKQPYRIARPDGGPFAFAGLWEAWRDGEGDERLTCTILTTEANRALREIHARMPVILGPDDYGPWLDVDGAAPAALQGLLEPVPEDWLAAYPVSTRVNNVKNDDPACIAPLGEVGAEAVTGRLP